MECGYRQMFCLTAWTSVKGMGNARNLQERIVHYAPRSKTREKTQVASNLPMQLVFRIPLYEAGGGSPGKISAGPLGSEGQEKTNGEPS